LTVRVEDHPEGVRVVLLDRPEKRNAINIDVVDGIRRAVDTAPGAALVLGSTGSASFSSGADLGISDKTRSEVSRKLYALYQAMQSSPSILLAAASGHAVGAGAQLLIACDLRFVAPDATIRFMGPLHGLAVGAWGLPSLVGRGRAMDLCLSMRSISSDEALAIGLVDRVVDSPIQTAFEYARKILELDQDAVAATKKVIATTDRSEALKMESGHNARWDGSVP
jgi:enoyl-CoA hydratase